MDFSRMTGQQNELGFENKAAPGSLLCPNAGLKF